MELNNDIKNVNNKDYKLTKFRKISEMEELFHFKLNQPYMAPCEQVYKRTIKRQADNSVIILRQSVLDDEFPLQNGIIRAEIFKCTRIRVCEDNPNEILVTDIHSMDINESVPTLIVNRTIKQETSDIMAQISEQLRAFVFWTY